MKMDIVWVWVFKCSVKIYEAEILTVCYIITILSIYTISSNKSRVRRF